MSALGEELEESSVELQLLTIKECFVYKVPPLRTASGHRAEDWDLANPVFTGCLKISQQRDSLRLKIFAFVDPKNSSTSAENTRLFGECPIEAQPGDNITKFVDAVIDSSRYYVVRLQDPNSSRTTLLGVGFRDREQAFDLKNCLNEYVRQIDRQHRAERLATAPIKDATVATASSAAAAAANYEWDAGEEVTSRNSGSGGYALSSSGASGSSAADGGAWMHIEPLRDGEKIKIATSGARKKHNSSSGALKPPPPPGSVVHFSNSSSSSIGSSEVAVATAAVEGQDDEWGDFNSAS